MMTTMFSQADAYEKLMGRWSLKLALPFAEFFNVRSGLLLDVGCGTGAMIEAALAAAHDLDIVGIDVVEDFIYFARERIANPRVRFDVGDAIELPYADATFDQTVSLLVLQFILNAEKAAAEMRRVTRPGGTVAGCSWGTLEMSSIFFEEAFRLNPAGKHIRPKRHGCDKPGLLASLWQSIGLDEVYESTIEIDMKFRSFEDYWMPFTGGTGPPGVYLSKLPESDRDTLKNALRKRLEERDGEALTFSATALAVRGKVPN
jgi:ubiquinone/menaquinone biosynthesis C-methylase UbiE